MKSYIFLLLIAAASIMACKEEEPVVESGIIGTWQRVSTVDTEVSDTLTPLTEGITRFIEITENNYREFENDSLVKSLPYQFEVLTESTFGPDKVMNSNIGNDLAVIRNGNTRTLVEIQLHNLPYWYVRQ